MCLVIGGYDCDLRWFAILRDSLFCSVRPARKPEFFFSHGAAAASGLGPLHNRGFTIVLRHTTLGRFPLDEWSVGRRDESQETDIRGPGWIRNLNRSKRAAADPRIRWQIRNSAMKIAYNGTAMDRILVRLQPGSVLYWYLKLKILGAECFPLETGFRLRQVTPYFCCSSAFRFGSLPVFPRSSYPRPMK